MLITLDCCIVPPWAVNSVDANVLISDDDLHSLRCKSCYAMFNFIHSKRANSCSTRNVELSGVLVLCTYHLRPRGSIPGTSAVNLRGMVQFWYFFFPSRGELFNFGNNFVVAWEHTHGIRSSFGQ